MLKALVVYKWVFNDVNVNALGSIFNLGVFICQISPKIVFFMLLLRNEIVAVDPFA